MNISPDALRRDTVAHIRRIDVQLDDAERRGEALEMATLLNAKVTAYNTLVLLQQPRPKK